MSRFAQILTSLGSLVLLTLVGMRFLTIEVFADSPLGFCLSAAAAFFFATAITWDKNVGFGPGAPWGALVVISSLFAGALIDLVFDFGFFRKAEVTPFLLSFFSVVLFVVSFGWWKLLRGDSQSIARQSQGGAMVSLVGGALIVAALLVKWLLGL
jgi:hypothetical protein